MIVEEIPYSGYFWVVKFSWMIRFVVICGKKISGRVRSKPHPSCKRRAMASSLEVKAVVRGCHQYKVVWDAQVGYNTMLSSSLSNHSLSVQECTFHTGPSFCCCLNQ